MDCAEPAAEAPASRWRWRALACFLILGSAGLHIAYLACDCPLDLAPDEAHYWDWSRHLDWSYYSKGPLVAYLIRIGCALAGSWSRALTGTDMLAVRLPAVCCGSLLLVSLYVLTARVCRRESTAAAVVALALTLPIIAAGSSLMTIDAPYTCCWGWALVAGHQAVFRGSRWAWPLAGLLTGVGILAKYTMVLWLPSLGLFLLATPGCRRLLLRPGFWTAAAVAALCCLPIIVWNARHDWVTLRHTEGHAGFDEKGVRWLGPLTFVGLQFLLLLGFWFVAWVRAMLAHRPGRETRPEFLYLWWMSAPMFLFFLLFSLKNGGGEPNWPVTAYLSGMVLTTAWLGEQLRSPAAWYRRATRAGLAAFCALGLTLTVLIHHSDWVRPLLARLSGPPTPDQPLPLRRFDPTCRLRGFRTLGAAMDRLRRAELGRAGAEPVLAATSWSLPGEVGFYCAGHPVVYSLGQALSDRHSQYDLWRPNPVADPDRFRGRTFLVVGGDEDSLRGLFERVEPVRLVTHWEGGHEISRWTVVVGHGFRGRVLPPDRERSGY